MWTELGSRPVRGQRALMPPVQPWSRRPEGPGRWLPLARGMQERGSHGQEPRHRVTARPAGDRNHGVQHTGPLVTGPKRLTLGLDRRLLCGELQSARGQRPGLGTLLTSPQQEQWTLKRRAVAAEETATEG